MSTSFHRLCFILEAMDKFPISAAEQNKSVSVSALLVLAVLCHQQ